MRGSELVHENIRPCPLELSTYLEASNICINSTEFFLDTKNIIIYSCSRYIFCFIFAKPQRHMSRNTNVLRWCTVFYGIHLVIRIFLQSFADAKCSGKTSCLLRLAELVYHKIKPCPMELPPYLEAGYSCFKLYYQLIINLHLHFLQSFADSMCSGKQICEIRPGELVYQGFRPCPVELMTYLKAAYECLGGIKTKKNIFFFSFFAKLYWHEMFRKGIMWDQRVGASASWFQAMPSGAHVLPCSWLSMCRRYR